MSICFGEFQGILPHLRFSCLCDSLKSSFIEPAHNHVLLSTDSDGATSCRLEYTTASEDRCFFDAMNHTGTNRAPDPKAVCLGCFRAVFQGSHRKAGDVMSEIGMDTIPLRERAQRWLDNYKAGNACEVLSLENTATIVAVFLNVTDPSKKAEGTNERVEELQAKAELLHGDLVEEQDKNIHLREEIDEMRKQRDEVLTRLRMRDLDIDRYRAKVEAYEFVIRCNGVSGAEVHT